jgi:hypothetical protein
VLMRALERSEQDGNAMPPAARWCMTGAVEGSRPDLNAVARVVRCVRLKQIRQGASFQCSALGLSRLGTFGPGG